MKKLTSLLLLILVFSLVGCNNVEKTSKVTLCDYNNIDLSKNNDLNENEYVAKYLLENSTVENYSKEEVEQYVTALEEYYNDLRTIFVNRIRDIEVIDDNQDNNTETNNPNIDDINNKEDIQDEQDITSDIPDGD